MDGRRDPLVLLWTLALRDEAQPSFSLFSQPLLPFAPILSLSVAVTQKALCPWLVSVSFPSGDNLPSMAGSESLGCCVSAGGGVAEKRVPVAHNRVFSVWGKSQHLLGRKTHA